MNDLEKRLAAVEYDTNWNGINLGVIFKAFIMIQFVEVGVITLILKVLLDNGIIR